MNKKVVIPVVLAVLLSLVVGLFAVDAVFAKDGGFIKRFKRANAVLGRVVELNHNAFSITRRDGTHMSYQVNDETKFFDKDRQELSFVDIAESGWVLVVSRSKEGGNSLAKIVVILPDDFDPENMAAYRGIIAGVKVSDNEFTLKTKDEQEVTFTVDAETLFSGQADDLARLEADLWARVIAEQQEDGSLLAKGVRSTYPRARKTGIITAINQVDGRFTIKGRDELEVIFDVDEETRFHSRDGKITGLEDLKEGIVGAVMAVNDPTHTNLLAKVVLVADRKDVFGKHLRFTGKVTRLDDKSFTIQTRNGKTITFQVSGITKFHSQNGIVQNLADLKEGMTIAVGAKKMMNGEFQALNVVILKR